MKFFSFSLIIFSFLMIFTTGFAFGELPVGQRTMADQEGALCMYTEPTSWIKEFLGPLGCVKVDYSVHPDCGKYSEEHRDVNRMSKCERPVAPEPKSSTQPAETAPKPAETAPKPAETAPKPAETAPATTPASTPAAFDALEIQADAVEGSTTITITGQTSFNDAVIIRVIAPNGNLVSIAQLNPDSDDSFTSTIRVGGPMWKQDGVYSISAQQGSAKSTVGIEIAGGVVVSIPAPKSDDPSQIIGIIIIIVGVLLLAIIISKKIKQSPKRKQESKESKLATIAPDDPYAKETNYWNQLRFEDKEELCLKSGINIKNAKKEFKKIKGENRFNLVAEIRRRRDEKEKEKIRIEADEKTRDAKREADFANQNAEDEKNRRQYTERELERKKSEFDREHEEKLEAERRAAEAEANVNANAASREFYPPAEHEGKIFKHIQKVRRECDEELDSDDKDSLVPDINVIGIIKIKSEPCFVKTKIGKVVRVCEASLEDETGKIRVTLWNESIDSIDDGDELKIEGGWVKRDWNGELELRFRNTNYIKINLAQKHEERRQKREKLDFLNYKDLRIYTPETKQCSTEEGRYTDAKLDILVSEFKKKGWDREDFGEKFKTQTWLLEQIIRTELLQRMYDELPFEEQQKAYDDGQKYSEQKTEQTHYDILEVDRFATLAEIKAAYRKMALRWHPDKNADDTNFRDEMMKKINKVYETLSDPVKRAKYDKETFG